MKKITLLISLLFSLTSTASEWIIQNKITYKGSKIRTGIKPATVQHKAYILYLQGLGDSMLNHDPLFNTLNAKGYSIIAFDYRGQGGSEGKMDQTTISNINELSEIIWKAYVKKSQKKILLGWSTGGLASYRYAYTKPEDTLGIIMLAPGIAPKMFVGETKLSTFFMNPFLCLYLKNECSLLEITERSLTQNRFESMKNPHIDPIKPTSPLSVPRFALNLLTTAKKSQKWEISKDVQGLIFLSDDQDTYVDRVKTHKIISENANHFRVVDFHGTGALHELDNEIQAVADTIQHEIISFLELLIKK